MNKIKELIKENPITAVIFAITLITILFVPIDKEYISYFDFKTLGALYSILVVIECLKDSHFFQVLSKKNNIHLQKYKKCYFSISNINIYM